MNALESGLLADDLEAVVRPGLDGLKLPKVEGGAELEQLDDLLRLLEAERGLALGGIQCIPGIESARGVLAMEDIARAARTWCLSFGAVDFARDLGVDPSPDGLETIVPLSQMTIISAAAGIAQPIDSAFSQIDDEAGLRASARRARTLSFQGKAVVHPRQIAIVNEVFTPDEMEIGRAGAVVEAARAATASGAGAATLAGGLIDRAHVRRAEDLLRVAEREARRERS